MPVVKAGQMILWENVRSGPTVILASASPSPQARPSLDKTSGSGDDEQPFPKAHAASSLSIFMGNSPPKC